MAPFFYKALSTQQVYPGNISVPPTSIPHSLVSRRSSSTLDEENRRISQGCKYKYNTTPLTLLHELSLTSSTRIVRVWGCRKMLGVRYDFFFFGTKKYKVFLKKKFVAKEIDFWTLLHTLAGVPAFLLKAFYNAIDAYSKGFQIAGIVKGNEVWKFRKNLCGKDRFEKI